MLAQMLALTDGERVAIITGMFAIAGVLLSLLQQTRKVHRENRNDHAKTMVDVKLLAETLTEVHHDVRDTRADVREIKGTLRHHDSRLSDLEPPKDPPK